MLVVMKCKVVPYYICEKMYENLLDGVVSDFDTRYVESENEYKVSWTY